MTNINLLNINLFKIFICLTIISCYNNQTITDIFLGKEIKGELHLDESHIYFSLKISAGINKKVLVFTTHEENDNKNNKNKDISFSDPDFYISKNNKYPSSRLSSEWYSQRYGPDIITISPESFNYAIGHKRCNVKRIKELYDVDIVVKSNEEYRPGKFEVEVIKE